MNSVARRWLRALAVSALLLSLLCSGAAPALGQEKKADGPAIAVKSSAEDDAAIARRLAQIYAQIDGMQGVAVRVRSGVVTLSGEVLTAKAGEQAVRLARQVEGVVEVDDDTEVVRDLAQQLAPAYERLRERLIDLVATLPLLAVALVVVIVAWLIGRAATRWDRLYRRFTANELLADLLRHLVRAAIVIVGLISAFEILDATALIGAVLGAAGLLGLALGFALRDTVENYIAGILLSLRQPFAHDDRVLIGAFEGAVVRLTPRATILMSLDGNHVRIPNAKVFNDVLVNYTRNPQRRFEFDVGVGADENLARAQHLAAQTLLQMGGVLESPPPVCAVEALGDFNVVLRVYGWMDQRSADFQKVRSEAIRLVKEAFDAAEISMPEPTHTVRIARRARSDAARPEPVGPQQAIDIGPRSEIEREIAEERKAGGGPDLLRHDAPQE